MRYEYTLNIPTCLEIAATGGVFVAEFDCTLEVAYWDGGTDGLLDWEVRAVIMEGGAFITGGKITEESDAALWVLIERAVKADFARIDEQVQERAHEIAEAA